MAELATMQKYEAYKDSGVDWLGDAPQHWSLLSNKHIFKLKKNLVGKRSSEYDLLSLTLKGIIKRDMENPEGKFPAEFDTYQEVKKGDFVFCLFDVEETPRTVGLSAFDGMITGAYTVFEPKPEFNKNFLYYFYLNLDTKKRLKPLYRGLRNTIPKESFFGFKTFVPPMPEQTAIANFLDKKTAQIDEAITIKEKQIELLKERKQIIIQQAVTKGLNPDAPKKNSGVDWIGEIPEHWGIGKAKYYSSVFVPERAKPNLNESRDGYPWVTTENLRSISSTTSKSKYYVSLKDAQATGSRAVEKNSVLATCVGSFGIAAINEESCIINQQIQAYTRLNINKKYLLKLIELSKDYFSINATMTTIAYVNRDIFADLPIIIPPNSEQEEIAHYIDMKESQIEQSIDVQKLQIEKLKEYKTTLINSAVTGKIKVPEVDSELS